MVNFILRVSPALLGALLLLSPLHASIIEGVDVADSVLVDGKQIPLYRTAVRKAMGFKIYLSAFYLDQKPMSAHEQKPTPSHPTNISSRLSAKTSTSIANVKRFRYAKYRQ